MGADFEVVDLDVVYAALRRDPRFAAKSEADFEDAKRSIALIGSVINTGRLGQTVTVESFYEVSADFLAAVLKTPFDAFYNDGGQIRQGFRRLRKLFRKIVKHPHGYALLSEDDFSFSAEVRALITAGELTFWQLIHLQPAVFLPTVTRESS